MTFAPGIKTLCIISNFLIFQIYDFFQVGGFVSKTVELPVIDDIISKLQKDLDKIMKTAGWNTYLRIRNDYYYEYYYYYDALRQSNKSSKYVLNFFLFTLHYISVHSSWNAQWNICHQLYYYSTANHPRLLLTQPRFQGTLRVAYTRYTYLNIGTYTNVFNNIRTCLKKILNMK